MLNISNKKISLKAYRTIRVVVTILLAVAVSQSIIYKNFIIPIAGVALSSVILLYFRKRVEGVVADERDYAVGGKAARWAIQLYSWGAVIVMFVLFAFRENNQFFEPVALTLAYTTCVLMLLYSLIFRFYDRVSFLEKKSAYFFLAAILIIVFIVAGLRIFSGEDDWICRDGSWVRHGNPSFPAPQIPCGK
jgi:uncharacterized membrane protein